MVNTEEYIKTLCIYYSKSFDIYNAIQNVKINTAEYTHKTQGPPLCISWLIKAFVILCKNLRIGKNKMVICNVINVKESVTIK